MRPNLMLCFIAIVIFCSCGNDDDGDLFPNGSRELTLDFRTFEFNNESFCVVSDQTGVVWFDSIYGENRSTKRLDVPRDAKIDLTFGEVGSSFTRLKTFKDVGDEFQVWDYSSGNCDHGFFNYLSSQEMKITVTGIDEGEILQTGSGYVSEENQDGASRSFSFTTRISNDASTATIIVIRDRRNAEVRSMELNASDINGVSTFDIDFGEMVDVDRHDITMDRSSVYKINLDAIVSDKVFRLERRGMYYTTGSIASDVVFVFVPINLKFDLYGLRIKEVSFLTDNPELSRQFDVLPVALELKSIELEDLGTSTTEIRYQMPGDFEFAKTSLYYEGISWHFYQLQPSSQQFSIPQIPDGVMDHFSVLNSLNIKPKSLEATGFSFIDNSDIPVFNLKEIEYQIRCLSYVSSSPSVSIP